MYTLSMNKKGKTEMLTTMSFVQKIEILYNSYLPSILVHDVIPLVGMETRAPPLVKGIAHQLQVTRPVVVMAMGKHSHIQVSQVLCV